MEPTTHHGDVLQAIAEYIARTGPTPAGLSLNLDVRRPADTAAPFERDGFELAVHTYDSSPVPVDELIAYAKRLQPDVAQWHLNNVSGSSYYALTLTDTQLLNVGPRAAGVQVRGRVVMFLDWARALSFEDIGARKRHHATRLPSTLPGGVR